MYKTKGLQKPHLKHDMEVHGINPNFDSKMRLVIIPKFT